MLISFWWAGSIYFTSTKTKINSSFEGIHFECRPDMLVPSATRLCRLRTNLRCGPRRFLFSLPDLSPFSPFGSQSETQKYHERKILPCAENHQFFFIANAHVHFFYRYSQKELYDVVSDVASYPHFVPFCTGSRILKATHQPGPPSKVTMDAELTVGFLSFQENYVSKVTCQPHESVEVCWLGSDHGPLTQGN